MDIIIKNIKKEIESNNLNPEVDESIADKDCYISSFLYGLVEYLQKTDITSLQEIEQLQQIFNEDLIQKLIEKKIIPKNSVGISLEAITHKVKHLFQKYISKKVSENLSTIQKELLLIVKNLFILCDSAKREIAKLFFNSLHNGLNILVYGYSMEVIYSLIYARMKGKSFTVYVAKSSSDDGSDKIVEILKKNDIDCKLISYNSISIYLPRIDFILTGAEAICENGGIINKVGTHITSICGKQYKKPFYVLVSSLKFLKMYVFESKNLDILNERYSKTDDGKVDFTPPEFITLFFTDKGIFLPNAICDEIIQLFYNLK